MATQQNPNIFPAGFATGLVTRNVPITQTHPGRVWWVSNVSTLPSGGSQRIPFVTGSDGNKGTWNAPFGTLGYAITQAASGDIIYIKPGHAETISAAQTTYFSQAGVAIIGLGSGSLRPTFTLDTGTGTTLNVTASNVTISNLLFLGNFAAIVACITVANAQVAKDLRIDGCEFRDVASNKGFLSAVSIGTTANIADGFQFTNNRVFNLATTGVVVVLKFASIIDRMVIANNYVVGTGIAAQPAFIQLGTSINHTNVQISGNVVANPSTDSTNGLAVGGSGTMTGMAWDNYVYNLDNTAAIWVPTGLALGYVQNFAHITAAADKNALVNPAAV